METKLKQYLNTVTEAVVAGHKNLESLSKSEQANSKAKIELFGLMPAKTRKCILLQASGRQKHQIRSMNFEPTPCRELYRGAGQMQDMVGGHQIVPRHRQDTWGE